MSLHLPQAAWVLPPGWPHLGLTAPDPRTSNEDRGTAADRNPIFFFLEKLVHFYFLFFPDEFDTEILPHKAVPGSSRASLVLGVTKMGSHLGIQDWVLGR